MLNCKMHKRLNLCSVDLGEDTAPVEGHLFICLMIKVLLIIDKHLRIKNSDKSFAHRFHVDNDKAL